MHSHTASLFDLDFYEPLPIQIEISDAPLTSDAGLLPMRQFDQRIGLTQHFAAALHDPRDPTRIEHTLLEMVRMRVFGIVAGYEDQNDAVRGVLVWSGNVVGATLGGGESGGQCSRDQPPLCGDQSRWGIAVSRGHI